MLSISKHWLQILVVSVSIEKLFHGLSVGNHSQEKTKQ